MSMFKKGCRKGLIASVAMLVCGEGMMSGIGGCAQSVGVAAYIAQPSAVKLRTRGFSQSSRRGFTRTRGMFAHENSGKGMSQIHKKLQHSTLSHSKSKSKSKHATKATSSNNTASPAAVAAPAAPPLIVTNGQPYDPNATLTLSDLQSILILNGYVRRSDEEFRQLEDVAAGSLYDSRLYAPKSSSSFSSFSKSTATSSSSSSTGKSGKVAFPQPSKLTPEAISRGTTVVGATLGCALAYTLFPNLWLLGVVMGSTYGNHIAARENAYAAARALALVPPSKRKSALSSTTTTTTPATATATAAPGERGTVLVASKDGQPQVQTDRSMTTTTLLPEEEEDNFNIIATLLLTLGKKLASASLQLYDMVQTLWFLYKTGQLSYSYYKQYEKLDQRFALQKKMDAWNARFLDGKVKFDAWEKENEVGRKVMAGLRTFWLVEEGSYKKMSGVGGKKKGGKWRKYRMVRMGQDAATFLRKLLHALFKLLTGGGSTELQEISQGIQAGISELNFERVGQQIGSGLSLIAALNLVGAVFFMSPHLAGVVAFGVGFVYPTWIAGSYRRVTSTLQNTAEKGRKQLLLKKDAAAVGRGGVGGGTGAGAGAGKYYYFVREDGSKRWYRTGQAMFQNYGDTGGARNNFLNKGKNRDEEGKRSWLFWGKKEKTVEEAPSWMPSFPFSSKQ